MLHLGNITSIKVNERCVQSLNMFTQDYSFTTSSTSTSTLTVSHRAIYGARGGSRIVCVCVCLCVFGWGGGALFRGVAPG